MQALNLNSSYIKLDKFKAVGEDDSFANYAVIFFSSLVAFYIVEQIVRSVVISMFPKMCARLEATGKERTFFGIVMGLVITLISTPSCSIAAFEAWTIPQTTWHLTPHAQVCIASRGILWVSDLNRLDKYPQIMLHHTVALTGLMTWLTRHWSNLIFLTIMATLVSEVGGDIIFLLSAYRDTLSVITPPFLRFRNTLVYLNVWQYSLIRGGGVVVILWKLYSDPSKFQPGGSAETTFGYVLLTAYTSWCVYYVLRQVGKFPPGRVKLASSFEPKN